MRNSSGQERTMRNERDERPMGQENGATAKTETHRGKAVYNIIEREGQTSIWNRIGTAFENRDGSINVLLNALPLDGKLQIREARREEE